jgi:predicted enzyme related to lactoylglutathione lyase
MAASLGLVLDCADPDRLGEFWSVALGYTTVGRAGNYVMLADDGGARPKILLQRVSEPKAGKNRMHFDIDTSEVDDEVARLVALGARRLGTQPVKEHGMRWFVMADPEGNEFCVCGPGSAA